MIIAVLNEFKRLLTVLSDRLGSSNTSVLIPLFNLKKDNYQLEASAYC